MIYSPENMELTNGKQKVLFDYRRESYGVLYLTLRNLSCLLLDRKLLKIFLLPVVGYGYFLE